MAGQMPASWKYFVLRTLNVVLTILIIALLISAFFTTIEEEDLEEAIHMRVQGEIKTLNFENPEDAYEYRKERIEELREDSGLDGSRVERVFRNAVDMMTLEFGVTRRFTPRGSESQVISAIIMEYLPYTILLFTTAAVLYSSLAIFLGLKAAQNLGSKMDKGLTLLGATLSSVPVWWAGMIFLVIFYGILAWYPRPSPSFPNIDTVGYLAYLKELLIKMSLPLFTIVLIKLGGRLYISRNIVSGILEDDYIMAARAKGLPENKVIYGHALKTSAPSLVTTATLAILTSLAGALITEVIFSWPGIGYLLRRALHQSSPLDPGTSVFEDRLIAAITFVLVVFSMMALYLNDIICGFLDPRVEIGSKFTKEVK